MKSLNVDLNNDDFISWIAENHLLCYKYKDYLFDIGVLQDEDYLEIGKGLYDSISKSETNSSTIFGDTINAPKSSFILLDENPILISDRELIVPEQKIILTHNAHVCYDISRWYQIHNGGRYDISVGVYGSIYDEDIKQKIRQVELLACKMSDDYTIDYDTDKDNYYFSLNSKRKIKQRILSR